MNINPCGFSSIENTKLTHHFARTQTAIKLDKKWSVNLQTVKPGIKDSYFGIKRCPKRRDKKELIQIE